jgi:hypothetical protein
VDRKFTSLLEELSAASIRNKEQFIEHRAEQAIAAIQNLRKLLRESFPEATASDLDKRLINAIKTDDPEKFRRGLKAHNKGE